MNGEQALRWLAQQFEAFVLPAGIPSDQLPDYQRQMYCECYFLPIPGQDVCRTENKVVHLAIKSILGLDTKNTLIAMEALGMPTSMRDYMRNTHRKMWGEMFGFFDDLAHQRRVKQPSKSTDRSILRVLSDVCRVCAKQLEAMKTAHKQTKGDRTRERILQIIKPMINQNPQVQRKQLIQAVVQASVCKGRQAENHICALAEQGHIAKTWQTKSVKTQKLIANATRQSVGRSNPTRVNPK